jgi:hypothetical protein
MKSTPPEPPAGAVFFLADANGRACNANAAYMWTWEGASQWFRVAEFPLPTGTRKETK